MAARTNTTTARLDAIEANLATLTAALTALVEAQAPAKPKASKVAAKAQPKAEVPAFIVERAVNRDANKALAAVLRTAGVEPKGAAWDAAKAAKAAGKTNRAIVAAARKAA